jgi:translocation and assembly module TamB
MRRAGFILLGLLVLVLVVLAGAFGWAQTGPGKRQILALIEQQVADPPARLHVDRLEGLVPFDMQLTGVTLADAKGVWFTADHLSLSWSASALLGGIVRVNDISSDHMVLSRLPESPLETRPPPEQSGPLLPNLPVDIDLRRLAIAKLELGPSLIGEPASFAIDAKAKLGNPKAGLQADLRFHRLDKDLDRANLTLDYRPASESLGVDLAAEEPQGGLVTKMLGLAGQPKLQARIHGEGPLADWHADGAATIDDKPLFDLKATSRGSEKRTVSLQAKLQSGIFLPADLAPLVFGGITVDGQAEIAGLDQPIAIDRLAVTAPAATLSAKGTLDPGKTVAVDLALQARDSAPFRSLLPPDLAWSRVDGTVHVEGDFTAPKVTAAFNVDSLAFQGNRIGSTKLDAAAVLHTDTLAAAGIIVSLNAGDIALADAKLQPLLADGMTLDFAGALDKTGAVKADRLDIHAGAVALSAAGTAQQWGETQAQIEAKLDVADAAGLFAAGGLQGKGALHLDASLRKNGEALAATLDAQTQALSLGIDAADRLLGAEPRLQASVNRDAAGTLSLTDFKLDGRRLDAKASGTLDGAKTLAFKLQSDLQDLAAVVPGGNGALHIDADVSGTLDAPSATVKLASDRLAAGGVTATALQARIDGKNLIAAPAGNLGLTARLAGLPAQLALALRADLPNNRFSVSNLKARLGQSTLTGNVDVAGMLANGTLSLDAPDLGELEPLAGQKMAGAFEADIALRAAQGKQNAELHAKGRQLAASGATVESLALDGTVADALRSNPAVDLTAVLSKVAAAGQKLDRIDAKATGSLADLSARLDAAGPDIALATAAGVRHAAKETTIDLSRLDLTYHKQKASLARPARIVLGPDRTQVSNVALSAQGGSLDLDAALTPEGNRIDLKLAKLPLSLAEAAAPDLHLLGTLDGTFQLGGTKSAPQAILSLKGNKIGVQGASAQLVDLSTDATWRAGRLDAKGRAALSDKSALDFTAGIPLAADPQGLPAFDMAAPLRADANGRLDLGLANAFIPGGADRVAGQADIALDAAGTLGRPQLSGTVDISNARYDNQRFGTRLRNINARIEGAGTALKIASLTAATPDGGKLSGGGNVDFGTSLINVTLDMSRARAIDAPIGTAVTSGNLAIKGNLQQSIALTGKVNIDKAEIRIPDKLPPDVAEIPVVEVNLPPDQAARLQALDQPPAKSMKIGLDLTVDAPQQVYVRGRGLDAELGGKLSIRGTADQPIILGDLNMRHGTFNLLSRNLEFSRGKISFSGGTKIDPELDFTATTKAEDTDITMTIGGTASQPTFALHSTPDLPQDEILARLLFGKASGELSPFEAVQLAQAAATLAGVDSGPGMLDKLRSTLGLDRLDVSSDGEANSGPSVSAGRYVSRGVFVGAKQGTKPGSTAATVEIELAPNIKAETEVGADSSGKAGINMEWNY